MDWELRIEIHRPLVSLKGLVRTGEGGFRFHSVILQGRVKYHKLFCFGISVLPVLLDSVTYDTYLTNGSVCKIRLFASRQLGEVIKLEQ